jgi:hypothetical protein
MGKIMLIKKLLSLFTNIPVFIAILILPCLAQATTGTIWLRYSKPVPKNESPVSVEFNGYIDYIAETRTLSILRSPSLTIYTYLYPKPAMVENATATINWNAAGNSPVSCTPSNYSTGALALNSTLVYPAGATLMTGNALQVVYQTAINCFSSALFNITFNGLSLSPNVLYKNESYTLNSCIDDPTEPPSNLGIRHLVCKYILATHKKV